MDEQSRLRVFLVDDHAMFRAGVRSELGAYVDVVGEASTVGQAVTAIAAVQPDVVLLDVHMPDGGGRAVLESVRKSHPQVKFLALSVSDAAEDVIGLIRAGARGYVTKTIAPEDPARAIRRGGEGDAVFRPPPARRAFSSAMARRRGSTSSCEVCVTWAARAASLRGKVAVTSTAWSGSGPPWYHTSRTTQGSSPSSRSSSGKANGLRASG